MNLLGSVLYDPAVAVSKSTASLLAMTAFDTTNLRIAITVPSHGLVRFRLRCIATGATTVPVILLGVLNGATVVGRVAPAAENATANVATQNFLLDAEFTASGLTPGAMNVDAAYAVQVVVAATNIKYGGPNTNAGANAWGAFVFEAWDPRPLTLALAGGVNVTQWNGTAVSAPATAGIPDVNVKNINNVAAATPGASGGVLISGSNAGTTTLAALTVTGATTHTGNVVLSDGLTISAPSTGNRAGLDIAGNGTGAALKLVAGATGIGMSVAGGGTSGDGIKVTTTSGHGVNLAPVGSSMHGLLSTGGNGGTSDGIKAAAGTGGVDIRGNITGNLVGTVSTLTTYTGNTVQTGDNFARIGVAGVGLTNLGDARIANLDAAVTTRLATAGYTAPLDAAGTRTAVGLASASLDTQLSTIAGYIDTEVGAIKTQTDKLTFTVANQVDVNIKSVRGTAVGSGTGTAGDPWGP